jgi:XTP/dITP diphosphohydrolase
MSSLENNTLMKEFILFVETVKRLRNECPWDKEQTHTSLRRCLLEESYEVLEAIDNNNLDELKKELGDLLLQVVFHTTIAEEEKEFTLNDVIKSENQKLISRHPHVFGNLKVSGSDEVKTNWEKLKTKEGRESILDGVPKELPALFRAFRIQEKASKVGFDWKNEKPVYQKILEEIEELKENIESGIDKEKISDEFGDVLFSIVNYSRFLKINPEDALRKTIEKFVRRFKKVEDFAKTNNKKLDDMSLEEMDEVWNRSK